MLDNPLEILEKIENDKNMVDLWNRYIKKSKIETQIEFNQAIESIKTILELINLNK